MLEPSENENDLVIRNHARLFAALLLSDIKDMDRFEEVSRISEERNGRWYEGEQLVFQAIREQHADNPDALHALRKARKLLIRHSVLDILLGREHLKQGEHDVALNHYDNVDHLLARTPWSSTSVREP